MKNYKSKCCNAETKLSNPSPDFYGDKPKNMKIGTRFFICSKCNKPCDIKIKRKK